MTAPTQVATRQARVLRTARIVWVAFLIWACGIILFAHRVQAPRSQPVPPSAVNEGIAVAAIADLALFGFLRRKLLERSRGQLADGESDLAPRAWMSAQMLGFASAMSIVLFGFVLHILGARPPWFSIAFFIAGLLNLAVYRPQPIESQ